MFLLAVGSTVVSYLDNCGVYLWEIARMLYICLPFCVKGKLLLPHKCSTLICIWVTIIMEKNNN